MRSYICVYKHQAVLILFWESQGRGETFYLYHTSETNWLTAYLSVFDSHIQGPSVHVQLGSPGREGWKEKWQ